MSGAALSANAAIAEALATPLAPTEAEGRIAAKLNRHDVQQWYGGLTTRERAVVAALIGEQKNREIAALLFIEEKTVERHIGNAIRKLGLRTRIDLAAWAVAVGLASSGDTDAASVCKPGS